MVNSLKSCRPSLPSRPVRPGRQGTVITLVHSLSVAVSQLGSSIVHSFQSRTVLPGLSRCVTRFARTLSAVSTAIHSVSANEPRIPMVKLIISTDHPRGSAASMLSRRV
jgi:hypothetical protein